jgi:hypothetical protein
VLLLKEYDSPFASHAADRVDHYAELGDIDYEDLGVTLSPWYKEYEDIHEGELLQEGEKYWEVHVHARDVGKLRDQEQHTTYKFNTVIGFEEMSSETFLTVEFPTWVSVFEEEFEESELYYPEYDLDSIF